MQGFPGALTGCSGVLDDSLVVAEEQLAEKVDGAARALLAATAALPRHGELKQHLLDAAAAQKRGYFEPGEDERLRNLWVNYLGVRAALWETVDRIQPLLKMEMAEGSLNWDLRLRSFGVGFAAGALLVRAAGFLVELAGERPLVWQKLDEAEPRYGIPRKNFTRIYRSLSSPKRMWRYHEAWRFYEANKADLASALTGPLYGPVWRLLEEQEPHMEGRKREYLRRGLNFSLFDFQRRQRSGYRKVMFHLFRLSGSAIADMRQPFVKEAGAPKRVTPEVVKELEEILQPGDVFVTRHDDALSNLFLPGFWPHAALYLGKAKDLQALGVSGPCGPGCHTLEARKDGVLCRRLADTLSVDAFVVLRPRLDREDLAAALTRALAHQGKLYDFLFDFRQSDRLACTAVIYRTYHGVGDISFSLHDRAGRLCLSAEDLLDETVGAGHFSVVGLYGVGGEGLLTGPEAHEKLLASYRPEGG